MITDRYFTDEEFENKEFNKRLWFALFFIPPFVFFLWFCSYLIYSNYEIKPIYLYIYTLFKYMPFLVFLLLLLHKIKKKPYERFNLNTGLLSVFSLFISFILLFFATLFIDTGENKDLIIDSVFITSSILFILYFIIYYFRYMKRAKLGRTEYINKLKDYHFILDTQSKEIEHNYFRIKNKKLEEKLDVLAFFIKVLTPTITTISIFIGYQYMQVGEVDPSIFILAFGGILGSAYLGNLLSFLFVESLNLNQIEKQIGRKIYLGLYPKTIARKKAEAKENEEYWEKRLEEEENKKSKKENS